MFKVIIFGGTTEGRRLCEFCAANSIEALYCAATEDGARAAGSFLPVYARAGRVDGEEMSNLFLQYRPELVIDATHPYAIEASRNIAAAGKTAGVQVIRVKREHIEEQGCLFFENADDLLFFLNNEEGNIFVATGSSLAGKFTKLKNYKERIWIRVLPGIESLTLCLNAGFSQNRIICMQGPFSESMNREMFLNAGAKFLVTKNSGAEGGFSEKINAAKSLGMVTAVLTNPESGGGVSLEEAFRRLIPISDKTIEFVGRDDPGAP